MKPARVDTKKKLEQLVSRLNEHQRRAKLLEAGETAAPAAPAATQASPAPQANANKAPAGKPAPTAPPAPEKASPSTEVTVDSVVEQLNAIRGGKSFKDTLVQQELSRYFEGLDDSEKEALHAYLKGLAQIVSGQIDAGQAEEPSNHGVETKTTGKKTRQIKPNVVKKSAPKAKDPVVGPSLGAPKEDTTPPAPGPIIPKKR